MLAWVKSMDQKGGQNYLMLEGHVLLHELPDQVPTAPWQRLHRLIATKE